MSISANYPALRPALLLDFANSQQLDPRVTFSRSTTAPYYDGKTSVLAEQNLFTYSQDFTNGAWAKSATTVSGTFTAPDGTTTANALIPSTSNVQHALARTSYTTVQASTAYTNSIYLKASGYNYVTVTLGASATSWVAINIDLSLGTIVSFANGSAGVYITSSITSVGNSWYRVSVSGTVNTTGAELGINFAPSSTFTNGSFGYNPAFAGDGTSGVYIWGAQLEQRSSATAYNATTTSALTNYIPQLLTAPINAPRFDFNPTTGESLGLLIEQSSTNLVLWSQDFSNAAWAKANATVTTTAGIAPDGTQTAQLLVENSSYGSHGVSQAITVTSSQSYTQTIYAKAKDRTWIVMQPANNIPNCLAYFNLGTGAIGTLTNCTATITSVGNGWYKCSATFTNANSTQTQGVYLATGDGGATYTGNGYSGVYIWGMQFENLAFPTSYIPTTSAQVTRASDNASMTGTNFSSWYNTAQGTWYSEFIPMITTGTSRAILATNNYSMYLNASGAIGIYDGTNFPLNGTATNNALNKATTLYAQNTLISCLNGINPTTTSAYNNIFASATTLTISGNNLFNGRMKKISYYPQALTSTQLQSLTGS